MFGSVIVAYLVRNKFLPTHLSFSLLDARLKRSFGIDVVQPFFFFALEFQLGFQFVGFVFWGYFFFLKVVKLDFSLTRYLTTTPFFKVLLQAFKLGELNYVL